MVYRVIFFKITTPREANKAPFVIFRCIIEVDEDVDIHDDFFEDYKNAGYTVEIQKVAISGKLYNFSFHETLEEAQEFCKELGYELDHFSGLNGVWNRKLFRIS